MNRDFFILGRNWAVCLLVLGLAVFPLHGQSNRFQTEAKRTDKPPKLDGRLDEPAWNDASVISDFIQFEPNNGEPASVRTEVRILYDDDAVYFGFTCYDPEPEKIVLGTQRDGLNMGTDSVCVNLDTFFDRRNSYYFRTNPLGVHHDGRMSENGLVADVNWDGVWYSAGAMIPIGWSAEIAIPFSTVKFKPGKDQIWGLQASRYFPRNLEKSFWAGPLEDYKKLERDGILTNLDLPASKRIPEFIPHIISRFEEGEETEFEVGLDARYDFSSAISGHLTINPDFATVEADQEQVNLTRFELNLPEKRNFFLEGNAIYNQRINLFYSRRIADILGAAKLYGKHGPNEMAFLSAQTHEEEGMGSGNFTVLRWKRDILSSSNVGMLFANRIVDGQNRGTLGLDTQVYLTSTLKCTGQLALSYGDAAPTDVAFFLRPSYDSSTFHAHLLYTHLGENFGDNVNAVGFIRDDNRRELDSAINKTFWLKGRLLDRIAYSSNYNIYWGMDSTLRSWDVFQQLVFDLQNKLSLKFRHNRDYKLFEKDFFNHSTLLELGYNTREWQSAEANVEFGKNFDADFTLVGGMLKRKITQDLSLEYGLTRLTLNPDPDDESTWIHLVRATQYFNKDLFLKLFFQTNSAIDKRNIQVIFAYRFQPPFGQVQIAYQKGTARFGEKGSQGHTLFIKFAWVF